jgi:predicted transcriptional regulator
LSDADHLRDTAHLVAAILQRTPLPADVIPDLVRGIHRALEAVDELDTGQAGILRPSPEDIQRSIRPEFLISFEDGRPYKVLKQHLRHLGMTAETYRAKWGLPDDYPMVAATYSRRRSRKARDAGFGRHLRQPRAR